MTDSVADAVVEVAKALVPVFTGLVGAGAGLLGGIWTRRDTRAMAEEKAEDERRAERASAIGEFIRGAAIAVEAAQRGDDTMEGRRIAAVAFTRVSLTLDASESDIEQLFLDVSNQVHVEGCQFLLSSAQSALHRWHRGELDTAEALSDYERRVLGYARRKGLPDLKPRFSTTSPGAAEAEGGPKS